MEENGTIAQLTKELELITSEANGLIEKYANEGLAQAWGTSCVLLAYAQDMVITIGIFGHFAETVISLEIADKNKLSSLDKENYSSSVKILVDYLKRLSAWAYIANYANESELRDLLRRFGDLMTKFAGWIGEARV